MPHITMTMDFNIAKIASSASIVTKSSTISLRVAGPLLHSCLAMPLIPCELCAFHGDKGSFFSVAVPKSKTVNELPITLNSSKPWYCTAKLETSLQNCISIITPYAGIEIRKNFYMSAGHVTMSD